MASASKYLGVSPDYILYRLSYQSLVLYLHTAPSYTHPTAGKDKDEEFKDASTLTTQDLQVFLR